jgi:phosphatidylglycerophosphatase A
MNRQDPLHEMFLTTGGLGFFRPASGTWGSLPPVVLAAPMILAGAGPASGLWWIFALVMAVIVVAFSAICVIAGDSAEARWGKDPSPVVADETAGMALTLLLMPPALFAHEAFFVLLTLGGAFVLFRAMDIAKPWPCNRLQNIPSGWGILLDDLVAAVYAAALAWLVYWII